MYIVVTGAAGFIGSNIVRALNEKGIANILAVDDLAEADKFSNLVDCEISDYFSKEDFRTALLSGSFDGEISGLIHQGACSDTLESDGNFMIENNYRYSVDLLSYCIEDSLPFVYASSAAIYGSSEKFVEKREFERPLNVYGYSKFLFDQYVRRKIDDQKGHIVGLRYFNVYGPREKHKGRMASVAFHLYKQYKQEGKVKIFDGSGGFSAGEQSRDFVSVVDVVKMNLWFLENQGKSGIYNCGSGKAQTFNDVAMAVVNSMRIIEGKSKMSLGTMQEKGVIEYIPFPKDLENKYQNFTEADLNALRSVGYSDSFMNVEDGVSQYVSWLENNS